VKSHGVIFDIEEINSNISAPGAGGISHWPKEFFKR
jgi:hypothetical protein